MEIKEEIRKEINRLAESNMLVIVEGPKDARALLKYKIINTLQLSKKPLFAVAELASVEKKVALLTDLDKKGKQLYGKLAKDLQKHGVKIDNTLRDLLFKAKLSHVEGIDTYLEK